MRNNRKLHGIIGLSAKFNNFSSKAIKLLMKGALRKYCSVRVLFTMSWCHNSNLYRKFSFKIKEQTYQM